MRHDTPAIRRFLAFLALAIVAGCDGEDDPVAPLPSVPTEMAVVLNSVDRSITAFAVDDPAESMTIGLGPDGSPVTLAARGSVAAVPLGTVPAVAVVDLARGALVRTVALPPASGATGVAFVNDSIAVVANSSLNSVTPVNVLRGTTGPQIPVGRFPQAIVAVGDTAFVLNAELDENFQPAGPATISVLTGSPLRVVATITLSGANASDGALASDGSLWVVQSGAFGAGAGRVSRVDPATLAEASSHAGFGDFPGAIAVSPDGRLFVGSFNFGVAIWDPTTGSFDRPPDDALAPAGIPATADVGFDSGGRLHALVPDCQNPASVVVFDAALDQTATIAVGICPIRIAFTTVAVP